MNKYITPHFKLTECICPCCKRIKIIPTFFSHMEMLEQLRVDVNFPIIINSGYRCPEHNLVVNGSVDSWHMRYATDIRPQDNDPQRVLLIYRVALTMEFGGIGKHNTFIHLDPREVLWRHNYGGTA